MHLIGIVSMVTMRPFFLFFFTILTLKYLLVEKNIDTIKELSFKYFYFFTKPTFIVVLLIPFFIFKFKKKIF